MLSVPAHFYRCDVIGGSCAIFPAWPIRFLSSGVYVIALALLTLGWRESLRAELPLRRVLLLGAAVHLVALLAPPFLSTDPLYYAAIGRRLARGRAELDPAADASLLALMPPDWRVGTSPYFPAFDQLARLVGLVAGQNLVVALRGFQLIGLVSMLGTAWLVARAFDEPREQARAAALVLFSPLAIIEGTQSGHNDALLALATAAFALALVRRKPTLSLLALVAGLLVKASALIVLVVELGRRALQPARRLLEQRRVLLVGTALALAALAGFLVLEQRVPAIRNIGNLLGSPDDPWEHCTHSVECLPRAFCRYILHRPRAAWLWGLAFRAAAGVWLLWVTARAAVSDSSPATVLRWISTALYIYYLLFHGYLESWYLLSLLPLIAFADPLLEPAMKVFTVAAVAYYPLDLLLDCQTNPVLVGSKEFFEAFIFVFLPSMYLLFSTRRRARLA